MLWKDDERMRCQDLPLLEMLDNEEPLWCSMTMEHMNKLYKDLKCKYFIMPLIDQQLQQL